MVGRLNVVADTAYIIVTHKKVTVKCTKVGVISTMDITGRGNVRQAKAFARALLRLVD